MKASKRKPGTLATLSALFLLSQFSGVMASSDQCASSNTGSDHTSSIYMSNGLCTGHCSGKAFAILQHEDCWCSDIAPGSTTDSSGCNSPCPGYPMNTCGNAAQGLYQYIPLGSAPSSTAGQGSNSGVGGGFGGGGSSASPSFAQQNPSPPPQQSTVYQTSVQTTTNTPNPTTVVQTSAATSYITSASTVSVTPSTTMQPSSTTQTSATTQTSTQSLTVTPSPSIVTSPSVVTVSGAVVTSMVTSSPTTTAGAGDLQDTRMATQTSHQLSNGAVAGITVGAIAGAALVILVALFFWWRRRRQQQAQGLDGEGSITRTGSVMSKMGLLRTGSGTSQPLQSSDGYGAPTLPQILTAVPGGRGPESSSTNMSENRRLSRPMFVDSRLNPNAIMLHNETSRTSIATLQDNQDYSRPLEVRNPD